MLERQQSAINRRETVMIKYHFELGIQKTPHTLNPWPASVPPLLSPPCQFPSRPYWQQVLLEQLTHTYMKYGDNKPAG